MRAGTGAKTLTRHGGDCKRQHAPPCSVPLTSLALGVHIHSTLPHDSLFGTVISIQSPQLFSLLERNHLSALSRFLSTSSAMLSQSVLIFLLTLFTSSCAQVPSLLEALQNAGASQFAAMIESDPTSSALYLSSQVQTVFAPADDNVTSPAYIKRRNTPTQEQQLGLQASGASNYLSDINSGYGVPISTKDTNATLGGKPQNVVTDTRNTSSSSTTRRSISLLNPRSSNSTLTPLLSIFSGLGNNVSIIKADIPYAGGVIQIVDG
jgi:hypothetical protein